MEFPQGSARSCHGMGLDLCPGRSSPKKPKGDLQDADLDQLSQSIYSPKSSLASPLLVWRSSGGGNSPEGPLPLEVPLRGYSPAPGDTPTFSGHLPAHKVAPLSPQTSPPKETPNHSYTSFFFRPEAPFPHILTAFLLLSHPVLPSRLPNFPCAFPSSPTGRVRFSRR